MNKDYTYTLTERVEQLISVLGSDPINETDLVRRRDSILRVLGSKGFGEDLKRYADKAVRSFDIPFFPQEDARNLASAVYNLALGSIRISDELGGNMIYPNRLQRELIEFRKHLDLLSASRILLGN